MFFEMLASFVQAVGAATQSSAAARAASYNARISAYNANVTEQQGQVAETQQRQESARRIGLIRANVGASGLSGGSASDLLEESAFNAEMDALNTRYNYKTKAQNYRMDSNLKTQESKSARTGGYLTASSILLAGAGRAYQNSSSGDTTGRPFQL